jgi:hypothetical protein
MSKVVNVAGRQSAGFPLAWSVHAVFWPLTRVASATAAATASRVRERVRAFDLNLMMCSGSEDAARRCRTNVGDGSIRR